MSTNVSAPGLEYQWKQAIKTITFDGTAGNGAVGSVALFTVSGGAVLVRYIGGRTTTTLTGASATVALGTTNQTSVFIGATTGTNMTSTNNLWVSTTPTRGAIALPAATKDTLVSENILLTVAVAAVATGVLEVAVYYVPWSSGATLV